MSTHIKHDLRQVIAAQDLTGLELKMVTLDGVICAAADSRKAAGVLFHGNVTSGHVSAAYRGISKATMGAACSSLGWPLKLANSGFLVPCASGDLAVARLSTFTAGSGEVAQVSLALDAPPVVAN